MYIDMSIRDGNVCDEKQWPQIKNEIYGWMKRTQNFGFFLRLNANTLHLCFFYIVG